MRVVPGARYEVHVQAKHRAWTTPKRVLQIEMLQPVETLRAAPVVLSPSQKSPVRRLLASRDQNLDVSAARATVFQDGFDQDIINEGLNGVEERLFQT